MSATPWRRGWSATALAFGSALLVHCTALAGVVCPKTILPCGEIGERACAAHLFAAEHSARTGSFGLWGTPYYVIQRANDPAKVLAERGRFTLVEGKVLSVRQAGSVTYLNFGRNWTQDFAATISRRMMPAFEAAGVSPKSLENRRIRVRGFVSSRGGPRIEVLRVGQIEVLDGK